MEMIRNNRITLAYRNILPPLKSMHVSYAGLVRQILNSLIWRDLEMGENNHTPCVFPHKGNELY